MNRAVEKWVGGWREGGISRAGERQELGKDIWVEVGKGLGVEEKRPGYRVEGKRMGGKEIKGYELRWRKEEAEKDNTKQ